ncbi:MAG: sigma-54 dependent transcriptional regulator [Pseudomonadota bacterium]
MEINRRILLIDDDQDFLTAMRLQLRKQYGVLTAQSVAAGFSILKDQDVDLVLLDVGLEGENGLEGIKKIHTVHPSVGVAMLSGQRDVQTVVEAIRAGAVDYLTKPVDADQIAAVMEKAIASRSVQERCEALLQSQVSNKTAQGKIVHKSEKMQKLLQQTLQVKGHEANVLVIGETGTGKELLARHIHEQEGDKRRPFIVVNCAAIPEHLLESELFGHEAGAFTGASRRRIGKFELADGGDIFLDEISTMKLDLQVKLLRVLQEKEFSRLGSNTSLKADFRVIAACNQSLEEMVETGSFRADLFHRLRVIQLALPPLRERKNDIPLLVEHFISQYSDSNKKKQITENAVSKLVNYSWPGNVRELANVVRSLVIMTPGDTIDSTSFPNWVLNTNANGNQTASVQTARMSIPNNIDSIATLKDYVREAERRGIEIALEKCGGDKSKAATVLGVCRTTFYTKLKELGMMD